MPTPQKINFDLAGLDMIEDPNGQIWFIEANSFPGFFQEQINRNTDQLKATLGESPVLLMPEKRELTPRFLNLLGSLTKMEVIYIKDNILPDIKKDHPNAKILSWKSAWKPILSKTNYVINSPEISQLTRDKYETYKLMRDSGILTPKTFLVSSTLEVAEVFRDGNYQKMILKPRFGCRGDNIKVLTNNSYKEAHIPFADREYILQEFIESSHGDKTFSDYRVLVASGKYIGTIIRKSKNPIVNICLGGSVHDVPPATDSQLAPIAETIVAALIRGLS